MFNNGTANIDAKTTRVWRYIPHEHLLVIQTDALLAKPIHPFSSVFLLRGTISAKQHTEYFTLRDVGEYMPILQNRFTNPRITKPGCHPPSTGTEGFQFVPKQRCRQSASTGGNVAQIQGEDVLQPSHKQGHQTSSTRNLSGLQRKRHITQSNWQPCLLEILEGSDLHHLNNTYARHGQ